MRTFQTHRSSIAYIHTSGNNDTKQSHTDYRQKIGPCTSSLPTRKEFPSQVLHTRHHIEDGFK